MHEDVFLEWILQLCEWKLSALYSNVVPVTLYNIQVYIKQINLKEFRLEMSI